MNVSYDPPFLDQTLFLKNPFKAESKEESTAPAPAPRRPGGIPTGGFALPGIVPRAVPTPEPTPDVEETGEPETTEQVEEEPQDEEPEEEEVDEPTEAAAPPPLPAGRPSGGSVPIPSRSIPTPQPSQSLPPPLPSGRPSAPPQRAPPAVIVDEPSQYDDAEAEEEEQDDESDMDVPLPPRRASSTGNTAQEPVETRSDPPPPRPSGPPPLPSKRDSAEISSPVTKFTPLGPTLSQRSNAEGGLLGVSIPHVSLEGDDELSPTSDFVVVPSAGPTRQDSRSSGTLVAGRTSSGSHGDQQYQHRSAIGAQVFAAAHSMLRDRSLRITPDALVEACLSRVEIPPREGHKFGLLIYSLEGDVKSKTVQEPSTELDEPCPGDVSGSFVV